MSISDEFVIFKLGHKSFTVTVKLELRKKCFFLYFICRPALMRALLMICATYFHDKFEEWQTLNGWTLTASVEDS